MLHDVTREFNGHLMMMSRDIMAPFTRSSVEVLAVVKPLECPARNWPFQLSLSCGSNFVTNIFQ